MAGDLNIIFGMLVEIIKSHSFAKFEQNRTKGMGSKREETKFRKNGLTPK